MALNYREFTPYKYMEWLIGARNYVMNFNLDQNATYTEQVATISDNFRHFMGIDSYNSLEELARNVKYFQMLAANDQHYTFLMKHLLLKDYNKIEHFINNKTPVIFCTYHVGSYRIINPFLVSNRVEFCLVVDQNYITNQAEESKKILDEMQIEFAGEKYFDFEILNAESRSTGLEIIRRLREGKSVLFYIDGNTGVNQFSNDPSKMIPVTFLKDKINARKGIAYLAYKAQVPILPVYTLRHDWLSNEMIFNDPIFPNMENTIDEHCLKTTTRLFNILEDAIKQYPDQWEGWFYINKFVSHPVESNIKIKKNNYIQFNTDKFELIEFGTKFFLINKLTQNANEITDEFNAVLKHLKTNRFDFDKDMEFNKVLIKKEALNELIEKDILSIV